jgi:hypothetical protein
VVFNDTRACGFGRTLLARRAVTMNPSCSSAISATFRTSRNLTALYPLRIIESGFTT